MKTNREILDEFGQILIETTYDLNFKILKENLIKNLQKGKLEEKISAFSKEAIEGVLFDFMKLFEENDQFKLYFEMDGQRVNLVEISEMLKAEVLTSEGWIERFSKEQ